MKKIFIIILIIISNFYNTFSQVPPYVATAGLVAWYPFNNNANDASGTGNNGIVSGATPTTDRFGKSNAAYNFDGIDDYIEVLNSSSLNFGNGTVNLWFKTSSQQQMEMLYKGNYNNASGEQFSTYINGQFQACFATKYNSGCIAGSGWVISNSNQNFSNGNWHMITGIFKSDSVYVYIDAIKKHAVAAPNINSDICTGNLQIGRVYTLEPARFNGILDDIGIWNRPLNYEEITSLYLGAPQKTNELNKNNYFSVYPNPTTDIIHIEYKTPIKNNHYFITDNIGKLVKEGNINKKVETINISSLSKGVYFLTIEKGNNYPFKIIKN
jgi:hypothetical protein